MKKLIICMFTCLLAVAMVGCKKQKKVATLKQQPLVVENVISMDRENMFLQKSKDYIWYETSITVKEFFDSDGASPEVSEMTNVFQVVNGGDVTVWMLRHFPDGKVDEVSHAGFWVEDFRLNDEEIKLTFVDAYNRMMEANCPKPHSRQCVLRKEVGPIDKEPIYIFGNSERQVYVNSVTGEVSVDNPVFPKE